MRAIRCLAGVVLLCVAVACTGSPESSGSSTGQSGVGGMDSGASTDTMAGEGLDVRLESVTDSRPGRNTPGRNPFRFGADAPQFPESSGGDLDPADVVRVEVPPAERVPIRRRLPLKFIGVVDGPSTGLVAVLTDGEVVFHGRQGDIVEGRYRILRVATERIEIELLPAGGRRVLALEGL